MNFWKHESELPEDIGNRLGLGYILTLVFLIALLFVLVWMYRKLGKKRRRTFMLTLAVIMPLMEASRIVWESAVGQFEVSEDLPLQICRIMLVLQPIAIVSDNARIKTFCYAFGLSGAVLAFTFPPLGNYPLLSFQYIRYVISHFILALAPLLWVIGERFRPRKDLRILLGAVLAMALLMLGINSLLGSNYFYVNRLPGHVDIDFGQPWYFIAITAFMMLVVTLMVLPFMLRKSKEDIGKPSMS